MIYECRIERDMEGFGSRLFEDILASAWGTDKNHEDFVRIIDIWTKNRNQDLPTKKQESQKHDRDVRWHALVVTVTNNNGLASLRRPPGGSKAAKLKWASKRSYNGNL